MEQPMGKINGTKTTLTTVEAHPIIIVGTNMKWCLLWDKNRPSTKFQWNQLSMFTLFCWQNNQLGFVQDLLLHLQQI